MKTLVLRLFASQGGPTVDTPLFSGLGSDLVGVCANFIGLNGFFGVEFDRLRFDYLRHRGFVQVIGLIIILGVAGHLLK